MPVDAARTLLAWYDANARSLPWRAAPAAPAGTADPYRVWLSEIMLQQTTVAAVIPYFSRFLDRWPTVEALANADEGELMAAWAGLGYYARARNMIACARTVAADHGGHFPDTEDELRTLPGIGAYTAAAIAAIAFGRSAVVVDGNVERVVSRLFAVEEPLPAARPTLRTHAASITPDRRAGDFAQAMMDLGATICTPRSPRCLLCPLAEGCTARARGTPDRYPVKAARKARPHRHGIAYWLEADGHVLLRRRPAKGLLGGMLALPGGEWREDVGEPAPPVSADWQAAGTVSHVFTHFSLSLDIRAARADDRRLSGEWWPINRIDAAGLPTLYARAAALGRAAFDPVHEGAIPA